MPDIAEFSILARSFALGETLPQFPDVAVEADRIVAHAPGTTIPCIWADDGDVPGFAEAMAADETVAEIHASAAFDGEHLYHVEWSDAVEQFVTAMVDHEGVILEASGRGDRWLLRIRFMTRGQFEEFQATFTERRSGFELEQLFPARYPRHTRGDVTPEQHVALTTATDLGYFAIPRDASIQDVADELGISHQAVSERLRRGTENVVRDVLAVEPIQDRR